MYHEAYHQEAQRRQRVIERKHLALERLKEQAHRASLDVISKFLGMVILPLMARIAQNRNFGVATWFHEDFTATNLFAINEFQMQSNYKEERDYFNMFTKQVQNKENKFDQTTKEYCRSSHSWILLMESTKFPGLNAENLLYSIYDIVMQSPVIFNSRSS